MANCWGPALGAKLIPYKAALILALIFQSLGAIVFGPEAYTVNGGLLVQWNKLAPYPGVTMYSLMWIVVTPVVWQALAIRQKTLLPAYLMTGVHASLFVCVSLLQRIVHTVTRVAVPEIAAAFSCVSFKNQSQYRVRVVKHTIAPSCRGLAVVVRIC